MTNQPPLTIGEKVVWHGGSLLGSKVIIKQGIYHGKVCWVGKLQELGTFWIVGIEMEKALKGAGDGAWETRHIFTSKAGHGLFLPAKNVIRQAEFNGHSNKITGSSVVMQELCKKGNKCRANEATSQPTPQNGPVNVKLSPLKGATNSTKNTQFSSSQTNASVDLRKTHEDLGSDSPKERKTTCFRRGMFNSLGRKEQESFLPLAQEGFVHEQGQLKASKGGLLNLFKWFSRKQTTKRKNVSTEQLSGKGPGSTTSLVSDSSSITFYPIRHSVSADNSKAMMEIFNKGVPQDGTPGIQVSKDDGQCRRSSLVSLRSNASVTSFGSRSKKRMAPQPPAMNKLRTTTSASELYLGASFEKKQPLKSPNDGQVYGKIKRKAPLPPAIKDKPPPVVKSTTTFSPFPLDNSARPISTFSSFSSVSLSGSSTLKSSTCSENDSLTIKSDSSPNNTQSSFCPEGKGPLSPKPWYKRKKNKSKDKESKSTKKDKDIVYELCMPDIQYARKAVNADSPNSTESRNIEAFYDRAQKNGQRFSILSSISDLDRAATEQLEREKAQRKASKITLDQSFYNVSPSHMLRQDDLIPRSQSPQGAKALVNVNKTEITYDNLHYDDHESRTTTDTSYCKQPTLKLTDKSTPKSSGKFSSNSPELTYVDEPLLIPEIYNQSDSSGKINYEEYIEQIRQELEDESLNSPQSLASKSTPLQKAIFDPELFYQLAKDAKINCELKFSNSTKNGKENTTKPRKNVESEAGATHFDSTPLNCPPPKTFQKNFGLRMNNFYTPDVSTILEGSESVTSSTTTPADDMIEDAFNRSLLSLDHTNSMMSLNSEYRMNPGDFQELAESFSMDSTRGSDGGRGKQGVDSNVSKQTKADQIREETLFMRERDNFLLWQKTMQETELTRDDDATTIEERKKKWICNACTLINQPWRLHCGACGSLRPPNPRRIDSGDFKPNSADLASSCRTPSRDSPTMSGIQAERNATGFNNENTSESGAIQNSEFRNTEMEAASNMNWESELQSYFTLFDDHANAIKKIESSSHKTHPSEESSERNEKSVYGKINVSKSKKLVVNNQGVKPKELMPNRGETDDMDLREIRRARIRKFQLNYSSSQDQQNDCANTFSYANERPPGIGSGVKEKIEMLSELTSPELKVKSLSSEDKPNPSSINESFNFFQKSEERKSVRKEPKKSQVLKPSGAVKSVISIFNQLDQLKSVQEKTPPVKSNRRKSVTNILNFSHFERLISGIGNETTDSSIPLPRNNSPVMADIDIASAISKFDEMAAFAEIDCLRKPIPKFQKKRFKPEIVFNNQPNFLAGKATGGSAATHSFKNGSPDNASTASSHSTFEVSKPIQLRNNVNNMNGDRDSCDSIIKDGILYTSGESRRRSMSIGSGTFELITAKDFASIEAHHSRRPSPVNDIDLPLPSELSHPLLMPEINNLVSPKATPNERGFIDMNTVQEEWLTHNSKNAVERLSRQLKEADGIATFKAMLEDDKPELGESNTKTITRLLKRLEAAISSEQHAEASRLAHDLAKVRLSLSPYKKPFELNSASPPQHNVSTQGPWAGDTKSFYNNTEMSKGGNSQAPVMGNVPMYPDSSMMNGGPSTGAVVKRETKVDPVRREVKSDITNWSLEKGSTPLEDDKPFNVKMYVEDKASHQGPIPLLLQPNMTVGDLKLKVSEEFGFPLEVQRWILGRLLADDDFKTLAFHKVTAEGCPIFLYLVAPESSESTVTSPVLSRSSSIRSHPPNEVETAGKSKVDKEIHSPQSKDLTRPTASRGRNYEEKTREHVKPKQNVKQTKKTNETGGKKKSSKFTMSGWKSSQQPNNEGNKPPGPLSKVHKPKSSKMKAITNVSEIKVNGELDSPRLMMEPVVDRTTQVKLSKPPNSPELKDGTNGSRNKDQSINGDFLEAPDIVGWICPQCTLVNPKERPGCEACATERPDETYTSHSKNNLRQAVTALDAHGCVPNLEPFDCMVCFVRFEEMEGAILRDCLHVFCRDCLSNTVKYSETAEVKCPFSNKSYSCQFSLQEREIKNLLSEEDYKRHLDKSVKEAAGSMRNVFYCKTPDCKGFCQYEDNVNVFACDVCRKNNCLTCQAQHDGVTCKQYQDDLAQKEDEEALKTKQFFDDIIRRGDGIMCPQCSVMLVRKWGCDWMRCPMCRTEICWVTRGPRWGPEGQGDTSGGCKCGLNGRKCHPKCTYCH